MNSFLLEIFCRIVGISAASGLVHHQSHLYLIADNSQYIYDYDINTRTLNKHPLVKSPNISETNAKKDKLDLEAIGMHQDTLFLFGSGSTTKRNTLFRVTYTADFQTKQQDLYECYQRLQKEAQISAEDFNIEGAIITSERILLFNRGNGPAKKNVIFEIIGSDLSGTIRWKEVPLPKIKTIETGFTDAILHAGRIYFIAAAEDANSTYLDGEIGGSIFGIMDAESFDIVQTMEISQTHKMEGITFLEEDEKSIQFLLCEDRDEDNKLTVISKLTISK